MSRNPSTPATPDEAEELARVLLKSYLIGCRADMPNVMNYLIKLCGVAGYGMANVEGPERAALHLHAMAEYVRENFARHRASQNRGRRDA